MLIILFSFVFLILSTTHTPVMKTWQETMTILEILEMEVTAGSTLKNELRPNLAELRQRVTIYLKYISVFEQLNAIYVDLIHPQKRDHIMETQILIILKLIQLRNFFYTNPYNGQTSNSSEDANRVWEYMDLSSDLFSTELKYRWCTTQTPIPHFIRNDAKKMKENRNALVRSYINHYRDNGVEQRPEEDNDIKLDHVNVEEKGIGTVYDTEVFDFSACEINSIRDEAVIILQRYIRGYLVRTRTQRNADWIKVFIGMMSDSNENDFKAANKKLLLDLGERKQYEQRRNEIDYQDALEDLSREVERDEGFALKQELREERIKWVTLQIAKTNKIPETLDGFYESIAEARGASEDGDGRGATVSLMQNNIAMFKLHWAKEVSYNLASFDVKMAKDLVVRDQVLSRIQTVVDHELLTNLKRINSLCNATASKGNKTNADKQQKAKNGKSKKGKKEKGLPGDKISELKNMSNRSILNRLAYYRVLEIPQNESMEDIVCSSDQCHYTKTGDGEYPGATLAETKRVRLSNYIQSHFCKTSINQDYQILLRDIAHY